MSDSGMPKARVLVVEDDASLRELLVDELRDAGLAVRDVATAEEALGMARTWEPDLVVSDVRLPGSDGLELLRRLRESHVPPAFLVVTAFGTISQAVRALKSGADDFLTKPLDLDHFILSVRRTLEHRRLRDEVRRFKELLGQESFHGLLGHSRPMRVLFDQIRQMARAQGPVLVVGESGTGKELAARALHAESQRNGKPFVAVNCAGIPESLIESELFGHEAGAFTGAGKARPGLFADASGGTMLLDEIAEMPLAMQAKLLRILQDGMIRPVGATRESRVDVRVVAATNKDLEEEVRQGNFREDLYYRLETFSLRLPPLRDRGEDVELLAAHFLRSFAAQQGKDIRSLSPSALERARAWSYPGNVRELRNAMERAVTFCNGRTVRVEHLPERMRAGRGSDNAADGLLSGLLGEELPSLEEVERRYIRLVLERTEGNKSRAATILGLARRTLYRRLGDDEASGVGSAGA